MPDGRPPRTEPISVHRLRTAGRARERRLTRLLETKRAAGDVGPLGQVVISDAGDLITIPAWVRGFRTRPVGDPHARIGRRRLFLVEATEQTGH
jgi:hypothetical protein